MGWHPDKHPVGGCGHAWLGALFVDQCVLEALARLRTLALTRVMLEVAALGPRE